MCGVMPPGILELVVFEEEEEPELRVIVVPPTGRPPPPRVCAKGEIVRRKTKIKRARRKERRADIDAPSATPEL
jgi:hypothetical protein